MFPNKKGAKILHLSHGDGIRVEVSFVPRPRLRKSSEIYELDELAIKGIQARGNKVSGKSVQSVKVITDRQEESGTPPSPEVTGKQDVQQTLSLPEESELY